MARRLTRPNPIVFTSAREREYFNQLTREIEIAIEDVEQIAASVEAQVSLNFNDLGDVSVVNAVSGSYVRRVGAEWVPVDIVIPDSVTSLSQLNDVSVSTAVSGHFLRLVGTTWQGETANLNSLVNVSVPSPSIGDILIFNGSQWVDETPTSVVTQVIVAILEDQKTAGTDGGTFNSGTDVTRDLNTVVFSRDNKVSLGSNQFELKLAGRFEIEWSAPAVQVNAHQTWLFDVTNSVEIARGTVEKTVGTVGDGNRSFGSYVVSINSSTFYEIRHRCNTTNTIDGLGQAGSFGTEVYARVVIRELIEVQGVP